MSRITLRRWRFRTLVAAIFVAGLLLAAQLAFGIISGVWVDSAVSTNACDQIYLDTFGQWPSEPLTCAEWETPFGRLARCCIAVRFLGSTDLNACLFPVRDAQGPPN